MIIQIAGLLLLMTLAWIDWHTKQLPNKLIYPGLLMGLIWHAHQHQMAPCLSGLMLGIFLTEFINASHISLRRFLRQFADYTVEKKMTDHKIMPMRSIGIGDTKMIAMLGSWFGPSSILPIIAISSLLGCLYALTIYLTKKKTPHILPFGSFLAITAIWLQCFLTLTA